MAKKKNTENAARMRAATFPSTIYVTREDDGEGDSYLVAWKDAKIDVDDSRPCAVYQLVEVGEVEVTKHFIGATAPTETWGPSAARATKGAP